MFNRNDPRWFVTRPSIAAVAVTALLSCVATQSATAQTGATLIKDIAPGGVNSYPVFYGSIGDLALLTTYNSDNSECKLWSTNGTSAGTVSIRDVNQGTRFTEAYLGVVGGGFLYSVREMPSTNYSFYKTDGTVVGTTWIGTTNSGAVPSRGLVYSGISYFNAYNEGTGSELWWSDGTPAGTGLFMELNTVTSPSSASGGNPIRFRMGGSYFYFTGERTDGTYGIWRSNGTVGGTSLIVPISPINTFRAFNADGDVLYYVLRQTSSGTYTRIYRADGLTGSTEMLLDLGDTGLFDDRAEIAGGLCYFWASTSSAGSQIWRTDGTTGGTHVTKNISPAPSFNGINWFRAAGNKVFFACNDGVSGPDLWVTDGTEAGTTLVIDLAPGNNAFVTNVTALSTSPAGDYFFFSATEPSPNTNRLYRVNIATLETIKYTSSAYQSPRNLYFASTNAYFDASHPTLNSEPFVVPISSLVPGTSTEDWMQY